MPTPLSLAFALCSSSVVSIQATPPQPAAEPEGKMFVPYLLTKDRTRDPELPEFRVHGQYFVRGEAVKNQFFNEDRGIARAQQRVRLGASMNWRRFELRVQAQDSRNWGDAQSPAAPIGGFDLYQGYAEFRAKDRGPWFGSFLRVGKQQINIGLQRLMDGGNWMYTGRAFNAARGMLVRNNMELELFWSLVRGRTQVEIEGEQVERKGMHLSGARFAFLPSSMLRLEALALHHYDFLDDKDPLANIANFGLHAWGKVGKHVRYDLEGNYQIGKQETRKHRAYAGAALLWFEQQFGQDWNASARGGFAIASGQSDDPEESTEFFNFYPANHMYYGVLDLFGWRNILDYEFGLTANWGRALSARLDYHYFQLQSATGRWTNSGGGVVAPGTTTVDNKNLGSEIDLMISYRPTFPFFVQLGYGLFMPTKSAYERVGVQKADGGPHHRLFLWFTATL